jgi:hypothetical protein
VGETVVVLVEVLGRTLPLALQSSSSSSPSFVLRFPAVVISLSCQLPAGKVESTVGQPSRLAPPGGTRPQEVRRGAFYVGQPSRLAPPGGTRPEEVRRDAFYVGQPSRLALPGAHGPEEVRRDAFYVGQPSRLALPGARGPKK